MPDDITNNSTESIIDAMFRHLWSNTPDKAPWSVEAIQSIWGARSVLLKETSQIPTAILERWSAALNEGVGLGAAERLVDFSKPQHIGTRSHYRLGLQISQNEAARLLNCLRGMLGLALWYRRWREHWAANLDSAGRAIGTAAGDLWRDDKYAAMLCEAVLCWLGGESLNEMLSESDIEQAIRNGRQTAAKRHKNPRVDPILAWTDDVFYHLHREAPVLIEAWDFMRHLQDREPVTALAPHQSPRRRAGLRVLGFDGQEGFNGTLIVEWLSLTDRPSSPFSLPYTWLCHPDCLLLARDCDMEDTFDNALKLARMNGWLPSSHGCARWHLSVDDSGKGKFLAIGGDSLSGALAILLRSMASDARPTWDKQTAVTAALSDNLHTYTREGRLYPVGSIAPKLASAFAATTYPPIQRIIVSHTQKGFSRLIGTEATFAEEQVFFAETVEAAFRMIQPKEKTAPAPIVKEWSWNNQNLSLLLEITERESMAEGSIFVNLDNGVVVPITFPGGVVGGLTYRVTGGAPAIGANPPGDLLIRYRITP